MRSLSIIVPVLNEQAVISRTLRDLRTQAPQAEILVVDGGSTDDTVRLATGQAHVISSGRGRAQQMNRGAWESRGEWLLFLHADTRLPVGFLEELERAEGRDFQAGAFRLRIVGRHPLLPLLSWGANVRTRLTGIALGDQALFCTRALFTAQEGFPPLPIMEDYVFTLRLHRSGVPLYLSPLAVETSGRRWDELGFWRTWWQFRTLYWRFRRESDLNRLREEYPDVR